MIEWRYLGHGWAETAVTIAGIRLPLMPVSDVLNCPLADMVKAIKAAIGGDMEDQFSWVFYHEPESTIATLERGSDVWRLRLETTPDFPRRGLEQRRTQLSNGPINFRELVNANVKLVSRLSQEYGEFGPGAPTWRYGLPMQELESLKAWRRNATG